MCIGLTNKFVDRLEKCKTETWEDGIYGIEQEREGKQKREAGDRHNNILVPGKQVAQFAAKN